MVNEGAVNRIGYWCGYDAGLESYEKCYVAYRQLPRTYQLTDEVCQIGNAIWYVTYYNDLFCLDLKTGKNSREASLSGDTVWAYHIIVHYQGKLVIMPAWGKQIAVYDLNDKTVRYCCLPQVGDVLTSQVYNGMIYLLSNETKQIYQYDMEKNFCMARESLQLSKTKEWHGVLSSVLIHSKLYFALSASNLWWEYDIDERSIIMHKVIGNVGAFAGITGSQDGIFLLGMDCRHAIFYRLKEKRAFIFSLNEGEENWICREYAPKDIETDRVFYFEDRQNTKARFYHEYRPYMFNGRVLVYRSDQKAWLFNTEDNTVSQKSFFPNVKLLESGLCRPFGMLENKMCLLPVFSDPKFYFSDGTVYQIDEPKECRKKELEVLMTEQAIPEKGMWNLKRYISAV